MSAKRSPSLHLSHIKGYQLKSSIPVYLPHHLTESEFRSLVPTSPSDPAYTFPALQHWFTKLFQNFALQGNPNHPYQKHPYKICELDVQAVDWFWRNVPGKEDKLGFMKIQAKIETDPYVHDGENKERADWLPGAVFLRGGSVAILVSNAPLTPPNRGLSMSQTQDSLTHSGHLTTQ
jgi:ADP-sugar diphosphatase